MALFAARHETIEGVAESLRAGETTCVEVLERCFDRIEEWETRVKAWVRVDREGALEQARALDRELVAGNDRGPLHGIPFGIKDIIDVQGMPTVAGFAPWRDRTAELDADVVVALRHAGAVIMGKTVTTQFACLDPAPTRNPWNLDRTPGGSSSGSAVAVALGMCLGAIGTQTGGSIIRPASFCGIVGFKPSFRVIGQSGIVPFAPSLDHPGPFARTTRDIGLIARILLDPSWIPQTDETDAKSAAPPVLLRPRGFFDRRADPIMLEAFEAALAAFTDAGAEVFDEPDDAYDFEGILANHRILMAAEAAAGHQSRFEKYKDDYAPHIRAMVEEGMGIPVTRYIQARRDWGDWENWRPLFVATRDDPVVMVTPAAVGAAPDAATTGNPCMNAPFSYRGVPAVTFPIALDPDGMPLGIQIVGGTYGDDVTTLRAAAWCESVARRGFVSQGD